MNRDERRDRVVGLPPTERIYGSRSTLHPSEPGGGTWIGVNDLGATFALINWYAVPARVRCEPLSRGQVPITLLGSHSVEAADLALRALPLLRINPFRLIGVLGQSLAVVEWRWDLRVLNRRVHPWRATTWASSGHDEPGAQRTRAEIFRRALRQTSAGGLDWLRRLHRSHRPVIGPYSHCMHRDDATTVSYTEVIVDRAEIAMRHAVGSPCTQHLPPPLFLRSRLHPPAVAWPPTHALAGTRNLRLTTNVAARSKVPKPTARG